MEANPAYVELLSTLFQAAEDSGIQLVTSVISVTEALTKPIQQSDSDLEGRFHDLFFASGHLRLISITDIIAEDAARFRAQYGFKTPDALQLSASRIAGCEGFLTNDRNLKRVTELRVLLMDDLDPQLLLVPPPGQHGWRAAGIG